MNAYLFTALSIWSQVRPTQVRSGVVDQLQTGDACTSQIVLGASAEDAQRRFETWLRTPADEKKPIEHDIKKIAAAQFVDSLFTESGSAPLDWPALAKEAQTDTESTPIDDFEPGYWVDANEAVRPGKLSFSLGTLPADMPEDIRSGLNWSGDKQFLFLLSVFSAPAPPVDPPEEPEANDSPAAGNENREIADTFEVARLLTTFPQGADKEAAAMIRARNAAVAAWLWRRYAANTRLAANAIRIDPWCGILNLT